MKRTWMASGILAAAVMGLPAPAQAGVRIGIVLVGHDDHAYYRDTYRIGFNRGYEDGLRHGGKDGHRHKDYNFWHDKRYRRGDAGYKRYCGPKHEYVAAYRRGYELGYRNAYAGSRHRHAGEDGYCYQRHDGGYDDRYRYGDRYRYRDDDRYRDRYDDRYDRRDRDDDVIYEDPYRR